MNKKSPLEITAVPVGPFVMNCYIVRDPETKKGILVDPGDSELDKIQKEVDSSNTEIIAAVGTHGHLDHVGQTAKLKEVFDVPFVFHKADEPLLDILDQQASMFGLPSMETPTVDRFVDEGDSISLGEHKFKVIHAPGHSPGSICLVAPGILFSGDVLFQGSIGRTDLWGGSYDTLIQSIKKKLMVLGNELLVYPGHGQGTTIEHEKDHNPFLSNDDMPI